MQRLVRTAVFAAVLLAFSGCAAIQNPFMVMSSDSPTPFFGGSISLPNKLPGR